MEQWTDKMAKTAYRWLFGDLPRDKAPRWVILPFENPDLFNNRELITRIESPVQYGTLTVGRYQGAKVGFLTSKFGAPAVAMTVDVLRLAGVIGVVGLGYCGGLRGHLGSGALFIPEGAVRDEGASANYAPAAYPAAADFKIVKALCDPALREQVPVEMGVVWSTDGILRESKDKIQAWQGVNVAAVDMETSCLLTVARALGIRAAAMLVVGDNPGLCREADEQALGGGFRLAVQVTLNAVAELAREFSGHPAAG